jgi:hypothetical protein
MKIRTLLAVALLVSFSGMVFAELQNVEVGGKIRIRGDYFRFDSLGNQSFVEQRTRLHVKADFTNDVSAFIELDSYGNWGDDFRSWYLCGNDFAAKKCDEVQMYQAYINVKNMWGTPLALRVGRQEIALGNQFLVGVNDASSLFKGLSFDAIRLTYATDQVKIDAIASKLAETFQNFGKGDVDFYTVYGSYIGIDDVAIDAYWMYVRDNQGDIVALANGKTLNEHTVGLRGGGRVGSFDFEAEGAYQFGNVDGVKNPWFRIDKPYADVKYNTFGANSEVGYTFDVAWQPRPFARFAYLGGGKPDQCRKTNDRTMPFDRLFSNVRYSEFVDDYTGNNGKLSNAYIYALGLQLRPTECISLKLLGSYIRAEKRLRSDIPDTRQVGWEVGAYGDYHYTDDLVFRAGYAHFFGSGGLETPPIRWSGLIPWQAFHKDQYDYVFGETEISF